VRNARSLIVTQFKQLRLDQMMTIVSDDGRDPSGPSKTTKK
jgi:hypothetical protein